MTGGTLGDIEKPSSSFIMYFRWKAEEESALRTRLRQFARSSPSSDAGEDGNLISMMANKRRDSSANMASALPVFTPALA